MPLLPFYRQLIVWVLVVGLADLAIRPHRWAKTAHGVAARAEGAPTDRDPRQDALNVQPTGG